MKIKLFYRGSNMIIEDLVNEFISHVNVIDIKFSISDHNTCIMVIYNDRAAE